MGEKMIKDRYFKLFLARKTPPMEERVLDSNAGKQLS
jgi:hypothetical protein